MSIYKYGKGSEPKEDRVPEDSEKTEEVRKDRQEKGTKQPAPAESGTNTYEEGEETGGDSRLTNASTARVSGGPNRS